MDFISVLFVGTLFGLLDILKWIFAGVAVILVCNKQDFSKGGVHSEDVVYLAWIVALCAGTVGQELFQTAIHSYHDFGNGLLVNATSSAVIASILVPLRKMWLEKSLQSEGLKAPSSSKSTSWSSPSASTSWVMKDGIVTESSKASKPLPYANATNMRVCKVCRKYTFLRGVPEFREVVVAGKKGFSRTCKDCENKNVEKGVQVLDAQKELDKKLRVLSDQVNMDIISQLQFTEAQQKAEEQFAVQQKEAAEKKEDVARKSREAKYAHNLLSGKENSNKASTDKSTLSDAESETLTEKLTELKGLLDSGLIDDQDYAEKKSELLKKF